jgi:hypothetical protein
MASLSMRITKALAAGEASPLDAGLGSSFFIKREFLLSQGIGLPDK